MITFYEYSDFVVAHGAAPAKLCVRYSGNYLNRYEMVELAERVFYIEDGFITDIKNRYGLNSVYRIDPEDELALRLKAVLL